MVKQVQKSKSAKAGADLCVCPSVAGRERTLLQNYWIMTLLFSEIYCLWKYITEK
jgi:hypothetical protein